MHWVKVGGTSDEVISYANAKPERDAHPPNENNVARGGSQEYPERSQK